MFYAAESRDIFNESVVPAETQGVCGFVGTRSYTIIFPNTLLGQGTLRAICDLIAHLNNGFIQCMFTLAEVKRVSLECKPRTLSVFHNVKWHGHRFR